MPKIDKLLTYNQLAAKLSKELPFDGDYTLVPETEDGFKEVNITTSSVNRQSQIMNCATYGLPLSVKITITFTAANQTPMLLTIYDGLDSTGTLLATYTDSATAVYTCTTGYIYIKLDDSIYSLTTDITDEIEVNTNTKSADGRTVSETYNVYCSNDATGINITVSKLA